MTWRNVKTALRCLKTTSCKAYTIDGGVHTLCRFACHILCYVETAECKVALYSVVLKLLYVKLGLMYVDLMLCSAKPIFAM